MSVEERNPDRPVICWPSAHRFLWFGLLGALVLYPWVPMNSKLMFYAGVSGAIAFGIQLAVTKGGRTFDPDSGLVVSLMYLLPMLGFGNDWISASSRLQMVLRMANLFCVFHAVFFALAWIYRFSSKSAHPSLKTNKPIDENGEQALPIQK